MGWLWVVVVLVLLVGAWFVFTYNRLVSLRNRTQEAWSGIDVELKRRHDLIPNLVETVKGYAAHESGTFTAVTDARAAAVAAEASGNPAEMGQKEGMLTQALRQLFAVAENYPELKAVASFQDLQQQLAATEDKIEFSRRFYNGNVRDYDTALQTLPTSLIGGPLGFEPFQFFQGEEADRALPAVSFGSGSTQTPPAQPP